MASYMCSIISQVMEWCLLGAQSLFEASAVKHLSDTNIFEIGAKQNLYQTTTSSDLRRMKVKHLT